MPSAQFSLEAGAPKRLQLTWKGSFKETRVELDGREIALVPDKKALQTGVDVALPDGSCLRLSFKQSFFGGGLEITRNGEPLPGSNGDPLTAVKTATYVLYFLAVVNLALGGLSLVSTSPILASLNAGVGSIVFAAILAVLAFFTFRRSLPALIIAIVLYAFDAIAGIALSAAAGGQPAVGGIFMKVVFLTMLIRGAKALVELKRKAKSAPVALT